MHVIMKMIGQNACEALSTVPFMKELLNVSYY